MRSLSVAVCLGLLCACATVRPDHFYILSPQPQGAIEARTASATQVILTVSLPSLVDRSEMVLNTTADGITVLEHERWAAPLTDLVAQTLAEDIERRRADLLVSQGASHPREGAIKLMIDTVQVAVRRGQVASIDVHWRILDTRTGTDVIGGDVFNAPLGGESYAAVARALSDCLALLADRLVAQMPPRERQ